MALVPVVEGVYQIALGIVNAYLIDHDGLTLIDTGTPGSAPAILEAIAELGRKPTELRHILVTHLHGDHTGGLAALKAATGAEVWMHAADAALVRQGVCARPMRPAPGLVPWLMYTLLMRASSPSVEPAETEHPLEGAAELPVAGGIRAIPAPGHSLGQLAFLWPQHGGVLFAADAAATMGGRLGPGIVYEDLDEGGRTLLRLAALDFAVACFGHGKPIVGNAAAEFRRRWPGAERLRASHP